MTKHSIVQKKDKIDKNIKIVFSVMILSTIGKLNASITLAKHSKMPNNIIMITPQTCDTEGFEDGISNIIEGKRSEV